MPAAVQITKKSKDTVFTLGELFPTGSAVDVLRGGQLTLWHEDHERVGTLAQYSGRTYVAAPLAPELEKVLRLPKATDDFGSAEDLVLRLSAMIASYARLDENSAILLAAFVMSSWVFDCLPNVPCLNLCGRAGTETTLLNVLSSVCRRPLRLAQASIANLAKLPEGLSPTVILNHPTPAALMGVLAAVTGSDVLVLAANRVLNLRCATIVCTQSPISAATLKIHMRPDPLQYRRVSESVIQQLADEFQPYLLRYRLTRHRQVANSEFDAPQLDWDIRMLARALGASLEGSPEIQTRIIEALRLSDEQSKAQNAESPAAIILEALLVACHEKRPEIYVYEVTELANGIFLGRHDNQELSPKTVGGILRSELGFHPERHARGYALRLSSETRHRIHRLASSYDAVSLMTPHPDCAVCSEFSGQKSGSGKDDEESHVHDVHEVHEVHEVHNLPRGEQ